MAMITRYRFRDTEEELAGQVFIEPGRETIGFVIFCQGMPYIPYMEAIIPNIISNGLAAIQIQYSGTYDSGGAFTPLAAVDSVVRLSTMLKKGRKLLDAKHLIPINFSRKLCVVAGHSFGSWVAYQSCIRSRCINYGVMFAPYFGFTENHGVIGANSLITHLDYVRRAVPLTHRFGENQKWDILYSGKEDDCCENVYCPVLPLLGDLDDGLSASKINNWIKFRGDQGIQPLQIFSGTGHGLEGFASDDHIADIWKKVLSHGEEKK